MKLVEFRAKPQYLENKALKPINKLELKTLKFVKIKVIKCVKKDISILCI